MLEITPSSISITHSTQNQTRHLILRNASPEKFAQVLISPCAAVPCVRIQKPERYVQDCKPSKILLRLPPGERLVIKVAYTPEKKESLYEDAIVVFSDLNERPLVVNLTCAPVGTSRVGSAVDASLLANIRWPEEIRPATSTSTKNLASDESDGDSDHSQDLSYVESRGGWVNDAGESVRSSARRRPPTATNGASKRQLGENWEALKRSYRTNFIFWVLSQNFCPLGTCSETQYTEN